MSVVVDTKDGLKEVCQNLCSSREEHERFRAECLKAREHGIKLIVLVEEDETDENGHYLINDIRDVRKWQNPRRKIRTKKNGQWVMTYPKATTGLTLMKTMYTKARRENQMRKIKAWNLDLNTCKLMLENNITATQENLRVIRRGK